MGRLHDRKVEINKNFRCEAIADVTDRPTDGRRDSREGR